MCRSWMRCTLRLRPSALNIGRDEFIEALRELGVGSSVLFIPLHFHSFYHKALGYGEGDFPRAEEFFRHLINLPVAPAHSPELIQQAAEVVAALLKKHRGATACTKDYGNEKKARTGDTRVAGRRIADF